ncbi:uncharacterized protein ACLA_018100 [Aspergillus clavatus NRRL 1]|uniref:Extracellular membrane protein CFEM domain-containing protein n=1 Tax=Aspergillus clavatus (strain ATCC 1007 / CBS 513.65 / DSM 816 / NCTC 3887 / NRRL 1 / QM 1276 / 107) TaxID=344612 RepID=A1CN85_ASPCL|nr:uncharacterized protein ACLA_018100 [Aspergillus clavatus NRRL 1]EAW07106.1 conserved hypothetical protein [Aspergillus clavatus NRRL 1]
MRSLLYLLLLALSTAVMADTYNEWVKSLSSCMQPCFNDFFDDIAKSKCGGDAAKSSKPSDINCICQSGTFQSSKQGKASITDCVAAKCQNPADQLEVALGSYTQMCLNQVNSDGTVPNSQGSVLSLRTSDMILLSGGAMILQAVL